MTSFDHFDSAPFFCTTSISTKVESRNTISRSTIMTFVDDETDTHEIKEQSTNHYCGQVRYIGYPNKRIQFGPVLIMTCMEGNQGLTKCSHRQIITTRDKMQNYPFLFCSDQTIGAFVDAMYIFLYARFRVSIPTMYVVQQQQQKERGVCLCM